MKIKANLKRFLSMSRQNGGFTLVELIVVIAILAILAGVAIPAYSGYITKANEAADQQLLSAVNRAFAAACNSNGFSQMDVASATLKVSSDGQIGGVTRAATVYLSNVKLKETNADVTDKVEAAFVTFFAGNEGAAFKTVNGPLSLDPSTGMFALPGEGGGSVKVTFGDVEFYISQEAADKLANSTFGEKIGSDALLGKVDIVSSIASSLLVDGDSTYSVIEKLIYGNDPDNPSEAYKEALAAQLDMHIDDLNGLLDELEAEDPAAKSQFLANSLVLSAAKNTEGMDTSFLGAAGFANELKSNLSDPAKAQDALAQAALAYGMYNAYANSSFGNDTLKNNVANMETSNGFSGMTNMLGDLEDPNFKAYMESDEGKADLEAYKSAMSIINESANQSPDAATGVLINGFQDEELSGLLNQIMGK